LRGLEAAFEHNALRLVDVAASVEGVDGRTLRRVGMAGVELAGIIGDLTDRIEEEGQ
jgi:hypothetical protein